MDPWKLEPARDLGLPPVQRFRSLQREGGLVDWAARGLWWASIRSYLSLAHRLHVTGLRHVPRDPPYVLIANHESHFDALVLAAAAAPARHWDRLFPIAAGDVFFETPAVAAFAAVVLNALPMWRKNCGPHALRQLREKLVGDPCVFILFPEGARSRDGRMMRFKAGLGMIVAGTSVPVVPCRLEGPFEAFPAGSGWPRFRRIALTIGAPLTFASVPAGREGWEAVAARSAEAVRALGGGAAAADGPLAAARRVPLDY